MNQQCKCGKGHVSQWDGKCGHCRTKKEQKDHEFTLVHMPEGLSSDGAYEYYRTVRKLK